MSLTLGTSLISGSWCSECCLCASVEWYSLCQLAKRRTESKLCVVVVVVIVVVVVVQILQSQSVQPQDWHGCLASDAGVPGKCKPAKRPGWADRSWLLLQIVRANCRMVSLQATNEHNTSSSVLSISIDSTGNVKTVLCRHLCWHLSV